MFLTKYVPAMAVMMADRQWLRIAVCFNICFVFLQHWFVVRRRDVPRAQFEGRPRRTTNHSGIVAVTPDRPWSIPIITWLNNFVWNVFTKNTFKIPTKSSAVTYLPPLWRHASLLNDGNCSVTHPVAKGTRARGTSSGTKNCVAS